MIKFGKQLDLSNIHFQREISFSPEEFGQTFRLTLAQSSAELADGHLGAMLVLADVNAANKDASDYLSDLGTRSALTL